MANDVIDRYQILEKIGAGGMGTVYLAWDREIERDVALKWLPAYFSQDEHFTERFKREARVVARLEHPHIVPIYDVGENEGRPFIIMRLLNGGTLRDQIGKPGFDLSALVKSLEEIGDALAAAHARHIIHRDIKPGNILFDEHGSAFLSDFGIAKVLDSATQLTGSGFIGTPAYMSPEQFIGQEIDGRSDQYALAVVVYETLTGTLPFQGNTAQMMYKHINAPPPEINLEDHPIPSSFNPVLQKALAKNPNDRYARILDFTTALRVAVRQDPIAAALPLAVGVGLVPTPQKPATAPTYIDTPPEEKKTEQLQKEYRDGLQAMSRSEWAAAVTAFSHVLETDPNYGNAAEFKQQAEANLSQAAGGTPASEAVTAVGPEEADDGHKLAAAAALGAAALGAAAVVGAGHSEPATAPADDQEKAGLDSSTGAAAAVGAAAFAGKPDLDKTSLDLPSAEYAAAPAEQVEGVPVPVEPVEDLDKTSLDLPTGAAAAAVGAAALAGKPDLEKTSLDLPSAEYAAAPAEQVEGVPLPVEPVEDLDKTSLDLPTGAAAAAVGAAALAGKPDLEKTSLDLPSKAYSGAAAPADLDRTSLDLPPGAYAAAAGAAAATPDVQPAAAPAAPAAASEKKQGIPLWAIVVGVILLLLLCGGGTYAAVNLFGPADDDVADQQPPQGGAIAAVGGQGTPDPNEVVVVAQETDTAEPEPTDEPLPEPTDEPTPEPVVVVEDTEEPPTPTEEPTEIPTEAPPMVRVAVSSANLRRGPGVVYRVVQPVLEDDLLEMIAKNRDSSWYLIMLSDGTLGWISSTVVELIGNASPNSVEIAATIPVAPTNTPVPPTFTPIPLPTEPPPPPGGGSGGGGGNGGGGDDGPPPVYTRESP